VWASIDSCSCTATTQKLIYNYTGTALLSNRINSAHHYNVKSYK